MDKDQRLKSELSAILEKYKSLNDIAFMEKQDPGIKDATLTMLAAAQGPKGLAYATSPTIAGSRLATAIVEKSPRSLLGLPKLQHIRTMRVDPTARDKLLWQGTGNALKYDTIFNTTR